MTTDNDVQISSLEFFGIGFKVTNVAAAYSLAQTCMSFDFQVEDYSRRKKMSVEEVERWLAPILGYDSEALGVTVS